jgi:hypothetical protein
MNPWGRVFQCFHSEWIDELNETFPEQQPELGLPQVQAGLASPPSLQWAEGNGLVIPITLQGPLASTFSQSVAAVLEFPKGPTALRLLHREDFNERFKGRLANALKKNSIQADLGLLQAWRAAEEIDISSILLVKPRITVWTAVSLTPRKKEATQFWLGVCG